MLESICWGLMCMRQVLCHWATFFVYVQNVVCGCFSVIFYSNHFKSGICSTLNCNWILTSHAPLLNHFPTPVAPHSIAQLWASLVTPYTVTPQSTQHKENHRGFPGSFLWILPNGLWRPRKGLWLSTYQKHDLRRKRNDPFENEGGQSWGRGAGDPQSYLKTSQASFLTASLAKLTNHEAWIWYQQLVREWKKRIKVIKMKTENQRDKGLIN